MAQDQVPSSLWRAVLFSSTSQESIGPIYSLSLEISIILVLKITEINTILIHVLLSNDDDILAFRKFLSGFLLDIISLNITIFEF